jgi:rhodanese-related sulfurtransferase
MKKFIFVLIILTGVMVMNSEEQKGILKTITTKEGAKLIEDNKANSDFVIIDVRTEDEFKSGHVEKARNIDFYGKDFETKLNALDKNKTYAIYCRSGNRSGQALSMMEKLGFKKVYNFGGIVEWVKAGFKTVK